jgi:hypothetical protein
MTQDTPQPRRGFTGYWMPKEIVDHKELSWLQRNLWCEINALQGELPKTVNGEIKILKGCWASNEYLAKIFDVKPDTISKAIAGLMEHKLIKQVHFDGRLRIIKVLGCLGEKSYADPDKNPDIDAILNTNLVNTENCVKEKPISKKKTDELKKQKRLEIFNSLSQPMQTIIQLTFCKEKLDDIGDIVQSADKSIPSEDIALLSEFVSAKAKLEESTKYHFVPIGKALFKDINKYIEEAKAWKAKHPTETNADNGLSEAKDIVRRFNSFLASNPPLDRLEIGIEQLRKKRKLLLEHLFTNDVERLFGNAELYRNSLIANQQNL